MNLDHTTLWLGVMIAAVLALVVRWQWKKGNGYDILDLLKDSSTGKASLYNHVVLGFALLSAWTVFHVTLFGTKFDPTVLLLGILGVFIVGKEARRGLDSFDAARKPPVDNPELRSLERK